MSFEAIGPFAYNRRDIVAAVLVVSFVTGALSVRIWSFVCLAVGLVLSVIGVVTGNVVMTCTALGVVCGIYLIGPALRSRKRSRNIYFFPEADGIGVETDDVRTTYKWSTIGSYRKIGSRLFIMVSEGTTLIVADRFTDQANTQRLIETLDRATAGRAAPGER